MKEVNPGDSTINTTDSAITVLIFSMTGTLNLVSPVGGQGWRSRAHQLLPKTRSRVVSNSYTRPPTCLIYLQEVEANNWNPFLLPAA